MPYVQGFLIPVPEENRQAYIDSAAMAWPIFRDYGCLSHWECWEEDVPEGELTSFPMAVDRQPGGKIVFAWLVWKDKAALEACHASMTTDPRWEGMAMPFDGKRMIYGGFTPVFSEST